MQAFVYTFYLCWVKFFPLTTFFQGAAATNASVAGAIELTDINTRAVIRFHFNSPIRQNCLRFYLLFFQVCVDKRSLKGSVVLDYLI